MPPKRFRIPGDDIRPIAEGYGACLAADTITVDGRRVGYMYREQPDPLMADGADGGWRFMAGDETQAYVDDPANWNWYEVNTIANYDPDIVPFLDAPFPIAFARDEDGRFVEEAFEPGALAGAVPAADRPFVMPAKKWPPPGFPLVQGDHALTETLSIHLDGQFARRVEDGSLVLWRPGLTLWVVAYDNNKNETQAQRLASIKEDPSPGRFDVRQSVRGGLTRFSYRLLDENEDGPVESLNAWVIGDDEQLLLSVYFDDPADAVKAQGLVDSVAVRRQA